MAKSKNKGWFERVMDFDWEGIDWDSESKVFVSTFKKQRDKVVIR